MTLKEACAELDENNWQHDLHRSKSDKQNRSTRQDKKRCRCGIRMQSGYACLELGGCEEERDRDEGRNEYPWQKKKESDEA